MKRLFIYLFVWLVVVLIQSHVYAAVPQIAGRYTHTVALKDDGTVWAWGLNTFGQLGDGTTIDSLVPVQVFGLTNVMDITTRSRATVALKNDGTVWAWGCSEYVQFGDCTTIGSLLPVQVTGLLSVIAISAGREYTVALKDNGTVWSWGNNNFKHPVLPTTYGQLGDGTTNDSFIPVQAVGLTNVIAVEARGGHTVALKDDGTVWTWGANTFGQLGDGTIADSLVPIQVSGLTDVLAVSTGNFHTVALKDDGTVWTWGRNNYGQLGDGTIADSLVPIQVSGLTDVLAVSVGLFHTMVLKEDGTVWTWGANYRGQLGDGTIIDSTFPVHVSGLTNVTAVAAINLYSVVIRDNGTVWAWGRNDYGQLGNGTTTDSQLPLQVPGLNLFTGSCISAPVLIGMQYPFDYIQNAYDAIPLLSTETIYIQDEVFGENLILDKDVNVTFRGGFDCGYTEPPVSYTYIRSMTITDGTITVENIVIGSPSPPPIGLLPDTGQVTSLTSTFGEDHDYTINPPSYTLNGDGTSIDNVTGLMWQSSDDNSTYNWYEASGTLEAIYNPGGIVDVCGDLSLAGYNDWRLPTENELQGIINYENNNPAIDQTYFPGTMNDGYWSSTTHAFYVDEAWIVDFGFPFVDYGSVSYVSKTFNYPVRCVRGGTIEPFFTFNGDGTITHTVTGLTWQQDDDAVVKTWEEALSYCEGLELPTGQTDWRLPNIKELRSIVDNTTHSPAINLTYFPNTNFGDYWSSTHGWTYSHHEGGYIPSGAWSVSFSIAEENDGYINRAPTTSNTYARCVRGGQ